MKLADTERKSLDATIEPVDESDDRFGPNGGFTAVLSTPSLDRDGDVLAREEWITPLPDHITVDSDHGMSVATTIGSARPYFDEGGRLLIDTSFSSIPRAQEVRTLVREGHIKTVSVAFLTDRSKKDGTPKRELLNAGVVAIPSNRDAIILDAKSVADTDLELDDTVLAAMKLIKAMEVKAGTAAGNGNAALVQAIHDAAGHLGAACIVVEVESDDDPSGDDDGANKSVDYEAKNREHEGDFHENQGNGTPFPPGSLIQHPEPVVHADTVEEKDVTLDVAPAYTLEQFQAALAQITSDAVPGVGEPQEGNSPADPPVEEAAAAADVAPAPADSTAGEAAESDVAARAARMEMSMWADSEVLSD